MHWPGKTRQRKPKSDCNSIQVIPVRRTLVADLPAGTLTFLFTDVVGSTRSWEDAPKAMKHAMTRLSDLISRCVDANGGIEVKSRGEGDSTFSVFKYAEDAVHAACSLQIALHTEKWPDGASLRVRAALHTGAGEPYDADYNNADVNRCARLRALSCGGQTLLSRPVYDPAINRLPSHITHPHLRLHRP